MPWWAWVGLLLVAWLTQGFVEDWISGRVRARHERRRQQRELTGVQRRDRASRRVYRMRPMVWVGPVIALAGPLVIAFAVWSGETRRTRVLVLVVFMALGALMLWISWWPRTVIEPRGLRVYGLGRPRFVEWANVRGVEIAPTRFGSGDGIVVTADGRKTVCSVPAVGPLGHGRQYVEECLEDITAVWTTATGQPPQRGQNLRTRIFAAKQCGQP